MNPEYLVEQLRLIDEYLRRARSVALRTKKEFLRDPILIDAAVREITVLFETAHNIAKHLISELGWRTAQSKAEAFEILAENHVLPEELCDAFRQASRFRNLATYQTAMIDNETVYRILTEHLEDFERFAVCVAQWLKHHLPS
jgi:uncharacterized protein YutE (UPF0331/DUF86 family)